MNERGISVLSLPIVAVMLAVLVLALLFLGRLWGLGVTTFYLLAIPVVLAVAYLAWYRTLPYEPIRRTTASTAAAATVDDEPFEDPVVEADEFERTGPEPPSDDDADEEPPAPPPADNDTDA